MKSDFHLRFVREVPCLVCQRPSQAHHVRLEGRLGVRSCDSLTVPLCADHHDKLHKMGERNFWHIFPVLTAQTLWYARTASGGQLVGADMLMKNMKKLLDMEYEID